jgi:hypothetical protein
MTYQSVCPKCGGETWDNSQDDKPGGDWRCKDRNCKDADGYIYNEWSFNKDQKTGQAPEPPPPSLDELEPPDDLPFSNERRVRLWRQAIATVREANDGLIHSEEALQKMIVTELIWLQQNVGR